MVVLLQVVRHPEARRPAIHQAAAVAIRPVVVVIRLVAAGLVIRQAVVAPAIHQVVVDLATRPVAVGIRPVTARPKALRATGLPVVVTRPEAVCQVDHRPRRSRTR